MVEQPDCVGHGRQDGYGRTALHWAACNGSLEVARLLLESGADVTAKVTVVISYHLLFSKPPPPKLAGASIGQGERVAQHPV